MATIENIQQVRAAQMAPIHVGQFTPSKQLNPADDISINIRSNTVFSPFERSFARYLRETLVSELKAAGVYAEGANLVIEGELTRSSSTAPADKGSAELAAHFVVKKDSLIVYDKELSETYSWESSFMGVVAIPRAIGEYTALYRKLIGKLFQDPEFRKAVSK